MISSEIRTEARKSLQGKWFSGVLIIFIYLLFSLLVSYFIGKMDTSISLLLNIIYFIITIPISFGFTISMMKLKRYEKVGPFDFLKDGFANFSRSWAITGHILLKLIGYIVVAILGLLVAVFSLEVTSISAIFSNSLDVSSLTGTTLIICLVGFLLYIVPLILMIPKSFLYVLSIFIGYDNPDLTAKEAVEKSAELMNGNRWRYFCLSLSFIGWAILSVFTLYIGLFWLIPYMEVSFVVFYEELAGKIDSNPVVVNTDEN